MPPIPKHKMALVIWLAIYPTITALLAVAGPALGELPLPLRTLVLTAILVPLMVFVLVPILMKVLGPWLMPEPSPVPVSPTKPTP